MTDSKQPGVEIDAELWEQFRAEVESRRGGVRGHLKTELETALREYIEGGQRTGEQISARLQRIESAVGVAGTDGGADVRSASGHRHTETDETQSPDKKPATKAARGEKLAYLTDRVRERETGDPNEDIGGETGATIPVKNVTATVNDEYGFTDQTTAEYVEAIRERLGLVEHPTADNLLCTPERREEILSESASDRLDDL